MWDTFILLVQIFVFTVGMFLPSNPPFVRCLSGFILALILFIEVMKYYG